MMRHALSEPFFGHSRPSEGRLTAWLKDFITHWRKDYAFAQYMHRELGDRVLRGADVEQARDAVRFAFADIRSPSFHLDDLPILQGYAPVHARRKVVVVGRDKRSQLRRTDDLR
jgi:hypothetical protein